MQTLTRLSSYFLEKERKRLDALVCGNDGGVPSMTLDEIKLSCLENNGYETPELNDKLYLHFRGFRKIENLEKYTGCRAIWLDSNGLTRIENLDNLVNLRCLYLSKNLISNIENITSLCQLIDLDLSYNRITSLDGLKGCISIHTLNLSHNLLSTADSVSHLESCTSLTTLDITNNQLEDTEEMFQIIFRIPSLATLSITSNPLSRQSHLRKRAIACKPTLAYLDRPIDDQERFCAAAWMSGGLEAESKAREEWRHQQNEKRKERTQMFKTWQKGKHSSAVIQEQLATEVTARSNCVLPTVSIQRVLPPALLQFTEEESSRRVTELAEGILEDKRLRDSIRTNQTPSCSTESVVTPFDSTKRSVENFTCASSIYVANPVNDSKTIATTALPVNHKSEFGRLCNDVTTTDSDFSGILNFADDSEVNSTTIAEASRIKISGSASFSDRILLSATQASDTKIEKQDIHCLEMATIESQQLIVESLQMFRKQMSQKETNKTDVTDASASNRLQIQKTKTVLNWGLDTDFDILNIPSTETNDAEVQLGVTDIEALRFPKFEHMSYTECETSCKRLSYLVRPTELPIMEIADSNDSDDESDSYSDQIESSEISTIASSGNEVGCHCHTTIDICALD